MHRIFAVGGMRRWREWGIGCEILAVKQGATSPTKASSAVGDREKWGPLRSFCATTSPSLSPSLSNPVDRTRILSCTSKSELSEGESRCSIPPVSFRSFLGGNDQLALCEKSADRISLLNGFETKARPRGASVSHQLSERRKPEKRQTLTECGPLT